MFVVCWICIKRVYGSLGKIFCRQHIEIFFPEDRFDISCKFSPSVVTVCMKCQNLFSAKNRTDIINLSSAVFACILVEVKELVYGGQGCLCFLGWCYHRSLRHCYYCTRFAGFSTRVDKAGPIVWALGWYPCCKYSFSKPIYAEWILPPQLFGLVRF